MFNGKTLLITGGTGSFGQAVLNRFLPTEIGEIRIFSRDEKKQDVMRKKYSNPKIKFYIGDVRDRERVTEIMDGVDYIFHAAALKQVPSCEFFPIEAVKTNILGTENVLEAGIRNNVKKIICLSTDKAVYPINAMGISKAMMEKVFTAKSGEAERRGTIICGTRYGNVMGSRGSVIPLFIEQIKENKPITITNPKMTRFMMSLDDAVDLVLYAFKNGNSGDIFVQKSPAATMGLLADVLKELLNSPKAEIKIIGPRHGEKRYESLLTKEEMLRAENRGNYYKISPDNRDLNYNAFFSEGNQDKDIQEYNSDNTYRLNKKELKDILLKLDFIKESL